MRDFLTAIPALIIVISAIVDAVRKSKKASTTTLPGATTTPPRPRPVASRTPVRAVAPIKTGYAGRKDQAALPEHARAIDSAGERLSAGAEYPSIVAERAADKAMEARFAAQVQSLESSESRALKRRANEQQTTPQPSPLFVLQQQLVRQNGEAGYLISAVIFSEILGPPKCRRIKQ